MKDINQFDNKELIKVLSMLHQQNEQLRSENELLQKQIELCNVRINNLIKKNDIGIGINDIVNKLFAMSHTHDDNELAENETGNTNIMKSDLSEMNRQMRDDIEIMRDDTEIDQNDNVKQNKSTLTGKYSSGDELKSQLEGKRDSITVKNDSDTETEMTGSGNNDNVTDNNDTATGNNENIIENNYSVTLNKNSNAIEKMPELSEKDSKFEENDTEFHKKSDETEIRKIVTPEFDTEKISGKFVTFSGRKMTEEIINETADNDNMNRANDIVNFANEIKNVHQIINSSNNDNVNLAGQSADVNSFLKKLNENLKGSLRKKYPKKMMKRWVNELVYLYNNNKVNSEDFQVAINISRPTLMRDILMLKNKGWLEYIGTPKIGFYRMTEEGKTFINRALSSTG